MPRHHGAADKETVGHRETDVRKISVVPIFFETMPYRLDESTGYIDYDVNLPRICSFSILVNNSYLRLQFVN